VLAIASTTVISCIFIEVLHSEDFCFVLSISCSNLLFYCYMGNAIQNSAGRIVNSSSATA
jgi:hypothetical protein